MKLAFLCRAAIVFLLLFLIHPTRLFAQSNGYSDAGQIAALRREMKQERDQLQAEIDLLRKQVAELNRARVAGTPGESSTSAMPVGTSPATFVAATSASAKPAPALIVASAVSTGAPSPQTEAPQTAKEPEPASIRYAGITITPGGFLAGESIWRQHAMSADMYTNYNQTPFAGSGESHMTEWVPSARQSRLSALLAGNAPVGSLTAYFEGDFLSAGTTSNNLQSNSYTMRVRQAWGRIETGKFAFTAGQTWSLAGENKKHAAVGQEALPLVFDGNMHVGFSYVRQTSFRAEVAVAPSFTVAASAENSQFQFAATNAPSNFFFGNAGAASGLNNPTANYTNQPAPDVIVKVAFDPKVGHYELGGIARVFRDRHYPVSTSGAGAQSETKLGGGVIANARFPISTRVDMGLHVLAGDGTGRYGASLLPDITVKPNGTLALLRNAQSLLSLQYKATKSVDLFAYLGNEYVQRTYYRDGAGTLVGYAPPSASNTGCQTEPPVTGSSGYVPGTSPCLGATRSLTQFTAGWIYRAYSGPMGRLQYGAAYSYLHRAAWVGIGGAPTASNNFVYTSVRYYLP